MPEGRTCVLTINCPIQSCPRQTVDNGIDTRSGGGGEH